MLKEMTDKEFTDSLVRKVAEQELTIEKLQKQLTSRALAVANRIAMKFLNYRETSCGDENYKLLMDALSKQKSEYQSLLIKYGKGAENG